jgi:hypothetical protein
MARITEDGLAFTLCELTRNVRLVDTARHLPEALDYANPALALIAGKTGLTLRRSL